MNCCIFGAASDRIDQKYIGKVEELGELLAKHGYGLVFGGGACGLMGAAARGFRRGNGHVTGVAPSFFNVDGVLFPECDELIYTETMRERKATMEDLAGAFVVVPGGIGTLEEFFEVFTLRQLGQHRKPVILYNVFGYFDKLRELLQYTADEGFLKQVNLERLVRFCETEEEILRALEAPVEEIDVTFYRLS